MFSHQAGRVVGLGLCRVPGRLASQGWSSQGCTATLQTALQTAHTDASASAANHATFLPALRSLSRSLTGTNTNNADFDGCDTTLAHTMPFTHSGSTRWPLICATGSGAALTIMSQAVAEPEVTVRATTCHPTLSAVTSWSCAPHTSHLFFVYTTGLSRPLSLSLARAVSPSLPPSLPLPLFLWGCLLPAVRFDHCGGQTAQHSAVMPWRRLALRLAFPLSARGFTFHVQLVLACLQLKDSKAPPSGGWYAYVETVSSEATDEVAAPQYRGVTSAEDAKFMQSLDVKLYQYQPCPFWYVQSVTSQLSQLSKSSKPDTCSATHLYLGVGMHMHMHIHTRTRTRAHTIMHLKTNSHPLWSVPVCNATTATTTIG